MTICPGKICHGAYGIHKRGLAADLEVIRAWGTEILVSLIEEQEYEEYGISEMGSMIPEEIKHIKLPIRDMNVPDLRWEEQWARVGPEIRAVLRRGGKVCIHCLGGLGRTGTVAARLLVELGMDPGQAIQEVRSARPGAIQTQAQERYVYSFESVWRKFDRTRACLLAGACGDALGATVEFINREEILARFGPGGIRDLTDNGYGAAGKITDDTQMSLFTAEGLIRTEVRGRLRSVSSYEGCIHHAYLRWLHTQGFKVPVDGFKPDGWLITHEELHHKRAPGITCMESLLKTEGFGLPEKANNTSKGCGGVMRVAPVGLFMAAMPGSKDKSRNLAFTVGCASARLTHGNPSGYLSAGAFSVIIHDLVLRHSLAESVAQAINYLEAEEGSGETIGKLRDAPRLAAGNGAPSECISELGQGWVGEEALAIAVFCALRAKNLEEGICMAVNITGDSDSTGSIAGNILGALYGCGAIPARWLDPLELKETIREIAEDLIFIHDSTLSPLNSLSKNEDKSGRLGYQLSQKESDWWFERYPGW
jgi:ADP-ribosylglycohydrolase/protein-tyrosine phosphatase